MVDKSILQLDPFTSKAPGSFLQSLWELLNQSQVESLDGHPDVANLQLLEPHQHG